MKLFYIDTEPVRTMHYVGPICGGRPEAKRSSVNLIQRLWLML
jgi:hypothetical protein